MKIYRRGKFRFKDYTLDWLAIALLLVFSITSLILDLSLLFSIFPMVYAAMWLWQIFVSGYERFIINHNSITVLRGRKHYTINIPSELTLVVSHVDICPPLAFHTAVGARTHILEDRFAISILRELPLDTAIEILHRNNVRKCTTSSIRVAVDDYHFVYSFLCDQTLFDKLTLNRKCLLIIPESLLNAIPVDPGTIDVYVDSRW